jgi:hypothetical protein
MTVFRAASYEAEKPPLRQTLPASVTDRQS